MTTLTVQLMAETCCKCGAIFGITKQHKDTLLDNSATFFCPNGHPQHYTQSREAKIKELEKKLAYEQQEREYWHKSAKAEEQDHKATRNQLRGTKAALTKTKKRISNGTCPCCSRTFKQLARHIRDKHPEYVVEADGAATEHLS